MLHLLMGTDGRVNRQRLWLGVLGILVLSIIAFAILAALGFRQVNSFTTTVTSSSNGTSSANGWSITLTPWGTFILYLLMLYPWIAIAMKRRHDRGSSGIDAIVIIGLGTLVSFITALGFGSNTAAAVVNMLLFVGSVYLLVVMGFLKGTTGANRYGPDPLLGAAHRA